MSEREKKEGQDTTLGVCSGKQQREDAFRV